jgi:hypothetical protein
MLIWWFFRRQIEKHLKIDCVVEKIEFFRLFATRYCCGISLRSSRRRTFWVDDLYHIQYWRILIKRELVRLLSMRRVNRCQISKLYVYSLTLGSKRLQFANSWWNVIKVNEIFHQTRSEQLINFDESDSLNLMNENVISSNDESDSSNLMNENVISSKWRKRLIKLDESNAISSNFWKDRQFFYFLMSNLLQWHLI